MRKVRKEVIDVPGVSKHLKKEGIPLNPVIRAGNFVFVSGLTPMDRRTGKIPLVTVDKQAPFGFDEGMPFGRRVVGTRQDLGES